MYVCICIYIYIYISLSTVVLNSRNCMASGKFRALEIKLAIGFTRKNCIGKAVMMLYLG